MSAAGAKRQKQSHPPKAADRPKRSRENVSEIQPAGLWVDRDVLRRHMSATPKFVIPTESILAAHNHYLELADLALQNTEVTAVRYLPKLKRKTA